VGEIAPEALRVNATRSSGASKGLMPDEALRYAPGMTALPVFSSSILTSVVVAASLGLLSLGPELRAQETAPGVPASLAVLQERFDEQNELLARPVSDLNQLYEKQLATLRETAKAAGDLDKVLILDEELRDYRSGFRDIPPKSFPELDRLRGIYSAELEKRQKALVEARFPFVASYIQQLEALSRELTRQDRLPEALAAREEAERMRKLKDGTPPVGPVGGASSKAGAPAGRMKGIGWGKHSDPLGITPRGITDLVSIEYWERNTFDTGWVALRANGIILTDQERRVSSTQDRIVAFDCSRAGGIVMVRDDGTLDASLCTFQPPAEKQSEIQDLVDIALARTVGSSDREAVRKDGTLVWWGPSTTVQGVEGPPMDARSDVAGIASGRGVFTALKKNGSLVVWKFEPGGDGRVALDGKAEGNGFTQVVMSEQHTLALKEDGEVVAWGQNSEGQSTVPPDLGPCTEVRVLHNVLSLAKKIDGTWAAWGRDYGGIKAQLNGASGMTHIVGLLFPPGEYAYAVWIENAD